jgi:hypothetical protein
MQAAKLSAPSGAVRLTLPARVANDLSGLQKALGQLAERLGHPQCATGCDILSLQLEREFAINASGELNPQPLPPREGFSAAQLVKEGIPRRVDVAVSAKVTDDLATLQKAIALTVGKLGCRACCSGFDITFRRELDLIAISDDLAAQGFGRFR